MQLREIDAGGVGGFAQPGQPGNGGAILNQGRLDIFDSQFIGNAAMGGTGGIASPEGQGGFGGEGSGGAIYGIGPITASNVLFSANGAYGGTGGGSSGVYSPGGGGVAFGGAIYSTNVSVTLSN